MTSVSMLAIDGLHGAGFQSETKPNTADQGKKSSELCLDVFLPHSCVFFGHSFLENLQMAQDALQRWGQNEKDLAIAERAWGVLQDENAALKNRLEAVERDSWLQ